MFISKKNTRTIPNRPGGADHSLIKNKKNVKLITRLPKPFLFKTTYTVTIMSNVPNKAHKVVYPCKRMDPRASHFEGIYRYIYTSGAVVRPLFLHADDGMR